VRASLEWTTGLGKLGVLGLGLYEVAAGRATTGLVVAALSIEGVLASPMHEISRVLDYWQAARISKEKLEGFLALPGPERAKAQVRRRRRGQGTLRFDHVSVRDSLVDVDVEATAGRKIAIVGPNGSGKSSLLALAAGLIAPDRGRVRLDRRDLDRLRPRDLRRSVGMVGPDLPMLRGSLRMNLCYRPVKVTDEELERVCVLCGVDEILAGLPLGLDTRIREGGMELSLGQRQRLALARALVGTPDLLLLDEIGANLDEAARAALERVLAIYPGTLLIATHDERLAARADEVWHLDGGRLKEVTRPTLEVQ
jgi:ABC-type bacteriocin/lantibiotic exporter with double-glycine peptidase domain